MAKFKVSANGMSWTNYLKKRVINKKRFNESYKIFLSQHSLKID